MYNNGEGGWINLQLAGASPQNQGIFQVIRTQTIDTSNDQVTNQPHNVFFVYNANSVEEVVQQLDNSASLITKLTEINTLHIVLRIRH